MIDVSHLTRRFGPFVAVDDVSFHLTRGEIVGFLGPNGAGKTTTMRILTGFLPASAGMVAIGGFDVLTHSLEVRSRIGYLPESVPLYREHRVLEMLRFQGRLHGLPRARARSRAEEVLERVGMRARERALIGKLSKGQRQRIGLAVALLPDPEVLILDEPTSGLDPLQRIEVRALIRELSEERTVLLSSHILPEIEATCPRVIILHRGRIAADGAQEELVRALGGESFIRVEALVGTDIERARRALAELPGARAASAHERDGERVRFELFGEGELGEAVGALARREGWTLCELAWQRPTLEKLFARIALELEEARPAAPEVPAGDGRDGT
jgi:ABC-2 type transport system ATP-binding protein